MAYKVKVSIEAHHDERQIVEYMISELKNLSAAKSFIADVKKGYENLASNPYMYSFSTDKRLQEQGYRTIPIKNYLIFYRIEKDDKMAVVVRVMYGGRDYSNLI